MEKVLLLNFSEKESTDLAKNTGVVVHRGYFEADPNLLVERDDIEILTPTFYSPDAIYEYAAVFINLNKNETYKKEFEDRAKTWEKRDKLNLYNYWINGRGFVAVFLGFCSDDSLVSLGIPVGMTKADESDTRCESYRIGSYKTDFREFLVSMRGRVKMPAKKYLEFSDKLLDSHEPSVRRILFNSNNDCLGAYIDLRNVYADVDTPICMLLPQFNSNVSIVEELVSQLDKITKLFPSLKDNKWQNSLDYLPSNARNYSVRREEIKVKYEKDEAAIKKSEVEYRAKYAHLTGLLKNQDDLLVKDVEWALKLLGINVSNSDEVMKNRVRKEDLVLRLDSKTILAEVKGTDSKNPSPKYVSQLLTHVALNQKPEAKVDGCMLIINHDLDTQPNKRPLAYSGDLESLVEDIIFLDTRVLHTITLAVIEDRMSALDAQKILFKNGRVDVEKVA